MENLHHPNGAVQEANSKAIDGLSQQRSRGAPARKGGGEGKARGILGIILGVGLLLLVCVRASKLYREHRRLNEQIAKILSAQQLGCASDGRAQKCIG